MQQSRRPDWNRKENGAFGFLPFRPESSVPRSTVLRTYAIQYKALRVCCRRFSGPELFT